MSNPGSDAGHRSVDQVSLSHPAAKQLAKVLLASRNDQGGPAVAQQLVDEKAQAARQRQGPDRLATTRTGRCHGFGGVSVRVKPCQLLGTGTSRVASLPLAGSVAADSEAVTRVLLRFGWPRADEYMRR